MKKEQSQSNTKKHRLFSAIDVSGIAKKSAHHIGVTMTAQAIRFVLQTGSTIVLARLLTPADFGLVAMVAVLVNFLAVFKDAGLAQATVQRENITHEQISTLFWINIAISLGLGLIVIACSPLISWIYNDSRLTVLAMVLAVPVMLSGFGLQQRALLQRNLRFLDIARAEIVALAFSIVTGVFCAYNGLGYWSLAIIQIANVLSMTVLLWEKTKWKPMWIRRNTGVREMLRFGANLSGFNILNFFSRNADNFLIGKFIGVEALGFYSRAYGLMLMPLNQFNAPISNVLLPSLARLRNDPNAYAKLYLKYTRIIAWVTAIPIATMSILGQELVVFLLGPEWQKAGAIFEWLAIAGMFQPLANITGVVFVSLGQTDRMFRWGMCSSICIVAAFLIGLPMGTEGVAMAYAIMLNLTLIVLPYYVFKKSPISVKDFFLVIKYPFFLCLFVTLVSRI